MGRGKRAVWVGVTASMAVTVAGCGPRTTDAAVGMSVDKAGNPVIVLQNCRADITQLEFYDKSRPKMEESGPTTQVFFDNEHPVQEVVQIPLLTGTNEWRPSVPVPKPHADGKFVVQAWGKGHEWLGRGTEFTLADLKGLKPGQVRHDWLRRDQTPSYGPSPATSQYRTTSLDDFITDDCP